jgi:hypothetical protein
MKPLAVILLLTACIGWLLFNSSPTAISNLMVGAIAWAAFARLRAQR